jgi:di/tricarboxylate transporter
MLPGVPLERFEAIATLVILAGAIYGYVREKLPPDLTSLLAILALLVTGVLSPIEAFAGFSHPAAVSVAAVLVLSAGLDRTGALSYLARRLLAPLGRSEVLLTAVLMVVIGSISAFINNTAAVAVFIPIVLEVCRKTGAAPGRLLMPMAHAATLAGICTLIGTSTNLAAHEYARSQGLPGFSMFELGKVGLPMVGLGFAYILTIGRLFLPHQAVGDASHPLRQGAYTTALVVTPGSPWIGQEVRPASLERDHEVALVALARRGREIDLSRPQAYETGDRLRVRGPLRRLLALAERSGLELHRPRRLAEGDEIAPAAGGRTVPGESGGARLPMTEIVVLPGAPLIGRTVQESRFAEHHDAVVLALHRPGGEVYEPIARTPIHAGDVLVVEGKVEALSDLAHASGFLVIGTPPHAEERPRKIWIAVATLVGVVVAASFGVVPIVTAATSGCAILMLTGCLRPREAYEAIDWSIIFVLAGALALGTSLQKTGITGALASGLAGLGGGGGPLILLAAFFVVAVLVSEMISNSGTVLLLAPVAVAAATEIGINPMSLVAAVTFGASASFAMPIGYQTSLMIYAPGGYRFRDYIVMGVPLDLLMAGLALWLIPIYWPLRPP